MIDCIQHLIAWPCNISVLLKILDDSYLGLVTHDSSFNEQFSKLLLLLLLLKMTPLTHPAEITVRGWELPHVPRTQQECNELI